ncbi:FxLD family lanthipeptide [Natronosporangium hydrolyticum]|uniref:FxLD family lanthipeptide n=1 Tax=Natronosporangium hydrolyticum TaxID=2811111 RepID=A0A895Y574_9ACTN|nr:FxLD family lanthipeptide [Natronosporangium hydrolyticum]QSB12854.1 FxLD family lanthipeptide [Natronosporangium hydrolyticum]
MSNALDQTDTTKSHPARDGEQAGADDWELDIKFIEAGDAVKHLIYMTNDQCGTTCQSACTNTCPS